MNPEKLSITKLVVIGLFAVLVVVAVGWFVTVNNQIDVKKTAISEQQETERTEERSQFWQKLIPWGSDESEASD